jgi:hypothetical protein
MGLFFNSDTQNKKEQILRDIAVINKSLRDVANLLDNNGMNMTTINNVGSILGNIEETINRVSTTVQGMSDSQLSGFNVPWMDGRYIGIMMWISSFVLTTTKISSEMDDYVKNRR